MVERFSDGFQTALTSAISTTSRPFTFNVAATSADLAGGTFSIIVYNSGTDANPVNAEILEVQDGSTTSWTASTEPGHTAGTHIAGSTVRLILTRRSLTQQMVDHTNVTTTPDPHTQYVRKSSFAAKGDVLAGTAAGVITSIPVGSNGQSLIADSTQPSGMRWGAVGSSISSVLTHLGDVLVGGVLGVAARLGVGTVGQQLTVVQNSAAISNPTTAPTISANATSGGSLTNGINYDFAYAWSNGSSPDGGTTMISSITSFVATTTGRVDVQTPAAPSAGLTLNVYAATSGGTLRLQGTLPNASNSTTNTVTVSSIVSGALTSSTNTTGGIGPGWVTPTAYMSNPMTTVADLIAGAAAGAPSRLPAPGSPSGQVLTVSAGPSVGWGRVLDVMTSIGDVLIGGTAGLPSRLGIGTTGQILSVVSGSPAWSRALDVMTTAGDVVVGGAAGLATRLGIGTTGQVLTVVSGAPAWSRAVDVMTSLGDLVTGGVSGLPTRLVPGTAGTYLKSGGAGVALSWSRAIDVLTSVGDVIIGGTAGLPTRLGIGTTGQILSVVSGSPAWARAIDVMTSVGDLITGGASGAPTRLAPGTSGTYLQSNGPGSALTWTTPSGGSSSGSGGGGSFGVPIAVIGPITATQAALTFSNIPTAFRNLRVVYDARGAQASGNEQLLIQFNGDTGTNYDRVVDDSGGAVATTAQTAGSIGYLANASHTAGTSSSAEVYIPDYQSTSFWKNVFSFSRVESLNRSSYTSSTWKSLAPITSLTLFPQTSTTFAAGSYACLYGDADTAPVLLTSNSNLIQETVLTAAQSTISIPNIPQGYRDLRIVVAQLRTDNAVTEQPVAIRFNGDTAAHYNYTVAALRSGAVGAFDTSNGQTYATFGIAVGTTGAPLTATTSVEIRIPDFSNPASTNWKSFTSYGTLQEANTTGGIYTMEGGGQWQGTAAITAITLFPVAGNFIAGTTIRVYGEPASAAGPSVGTGTKLRMSANQTIATATPTVLGWDTEDKDADNQHYTSVAALTGTVAKAASLALTGTSTLFTTELSIGQVISVPGTATEKRVVVAIASDTSLTVNTPFANTASGQTATRVNSAVVFRQPGFFAINASIYSAALASGTVTLGLRLNDATTPIKQEDRTAINASAGYGIALQRDFQQWDFIEVVWTQNSGGSVDVVADERTHLTVAARPTVIVGPPTAVLVEQISSGTDAGGFTQGSYVTRNLNTKLSDSAGFVTFDSTLHRFTLGPGSYQLRGSAPAVQVNRHKTRIYNVTDAVAAIQGSSEYATSTAGEPQTRSMIDGDIVITGTKTFEFQHQAGTTRATYGMGVASSATGTMAVADVETYAILRITKVG